MKATETYILTWIGPIISHDEVMGLFNSVNGELSKIGGVGISSRGGLQVIPLQLPQEALKIEIEVPLQSLQERELFRRDLFGSIYDKTFQLETYAISLLSQETKLAPKKLCVFDMDSTLIDQEVIDELARVMGKYDYVAEITERAMRGELDFPSALRERVKLLKDLNLDEAKTVIEALRVTAGGKELIEYFRQNQVITSVVSGGFQFILDHFKDELLLDHVHGHSLEQDQERKFTGEVKEPIIDAEAKRRFVQQMKQKHHAMTEHTIAVGDGANDLEMMKEAGMGVSFCGKRKLAETANTLILHRNLLWIRALL